MKELTIHQNLNLTDLSTLKRIVFEGPAQIKAAENYYKSLHKSGKITSEKYQEYRESVRQAVFTLFRALKAIGRGYVDRRGSEELNIGTADISEFEIIYRQLPKTEQEYARYLFEDDQLLDVLIDEAILKDNIPAPRRIRTQYEARKREKEQSDVKALPTGKLNNQLRVVPHTKLTDETWQEMIARKQEDRELKVTPENRLDILKAANPLFKLKVLKGYHFHTFSFCIYYHDTSVTFSELESWTGRPKEKNISILENLAALRLISVEISEESFYVKILPCEESDILNMALTQRDAQKALDKSRVSKKIWDAIELTEQSIDSDQYTRPISLKNYHRNFKTLSRKLEGLNNKDATFKNYLSWFITEKLEKRADYDFFTGKHNFLFFHLVDDFMLYLLYDRHHIELCNMLFEHGPIEHKEDQREKLTREWSRDFRYLVEKDGRDFDLVKRVLKWVLQSNTPHREKIKDARAFRALFDTLYAAYPKTKKKSKTRTFKGANVGQLLSELN